eukprot:364472-Chlamydomonas_euryale.AAC.1
MPMVNLVDGHVGSRHLERHADERLRGLHFIRRACMADFPLGGQRLRVCVQQTGAALARSAAAQRSLP